MTNLTRAQTFSLYLSYSTIITMAMNLNGHWCVESQQSGVRTSQLGLSMQKVRTDCDVLEQAKGFCVEAEWNARTSPSLIVILKIKAIDMA